MINAAVKSPFADMADEWILWCKKEPLSLLKEEKQTDSRSVLQRNEQEQVTAAPYMPPTNRYNAVLARINQASRKTGNFSAWSN